MVFFDILVRSSSGNKRLAPPSIDRQGHSSTESSNLAAPELSALRRASSGKRSREDFVMCDYRVDLGGFDFTRNPRVLPDPISFTSEIEFISADVGIAIRLAAWPPDFK